MLVFNKVFGCALGDSLIMNTFLMFQFHAFCLILCWGLDVWLNFYFTSVSTCSLLELRGKRTSFRVLILHWYLTLHWYLNDNILSFRLTTKQRKGQVSVPWYFIDIRYFNNILSLRLATNWSIFSIYFQFFIIILFTISYINGSRKFSIEDREFIFIKYVDIEINTEYWQP